MKKIIGLDALRTVAVLLVIRAHWGPESFNTFPTLTFIVKKIIPSGAFGVDTFFVLSGFLITKILIQVKEEAGPKYKTQILKVFIARRCLRIFPIYYITLFLLLIINYPDVRHYFFYFATYTSNYLSFFQKAWNGYSHTWTLAVEEQFYFIWPLVIIFSPNRYLLKIILCFIIISSILAVVTQPMYGPFFYVLTFNCFNAFAIGGLYSYATFKNEIGVKIRKWLLFALPFALLLYIIKLFDVELLPIRLINSIIAINIIIYITEKKYGRYAAPIIENEALNSLGKVSYGIYLFHYIVPHLYYRALNGMGISSNTNSPIAYFFYTPAIAEILHFLILISVSYISFYVIEKKFLRYKKYLKYRKTNNEDSNMQKSLTV